MAKATISDKNTVMSFVIPKDLKMQLTEIADKENRSLSSLIVSAIKDFVDNYDHKDKQNLKEYSISFDDQDNIYIMLENDLTMHENTIKRIRAYYEQLLKLHNTTSKSEDT